MKATTLTIRLNDDQNKLLTKVARQSGKSRGEMTRKLLQRYLIIQQFDSLWRQTMPFTEARGFLTDEDVFSEVS
jgi:hypothetical protein